VSRNCCWTPRPASTHGAHRPRYRSPSAPARPRPEAAGLILGSGRHSPRSSPTNHRLPSIAGAQRLRVRGGAHLTVAFGLGAAVPTTTSWPVIVEDQVGATWGLPGGNSTARRFALREESEESQASSAGTPVAIYIDLVPVQAPGDAFASHIAEHHGHHAVLPARRGPIPAGVSSSMVSDLAQRIRTCAAQAATHRVHLFLRIPFPIAVLLGRTLNTLETTLYEWDDTSAIPRYIRAITVASGRGGGPDQPQPTPENPHDHT